MIKIINQTLFVCLLLFFSQTLFADTIKIGFVNTSRLLKEAPQADLARRKLESEFAPRDKKIVDMQKQLKILEDKIIKEANLTGDSVKKNLEREIAAKKRDIKRAREEFTEDLNIRRNEELNKLQKLVYEEIVTHSKENNFDLILGDSVLYANKRIDVTDQILARLKNK